MPFKQSLASVRVLDVIGTALKGKNPINVGDNIDKDEIISTGPDGRMVVEMPNGLRMRVHPNSMFSVVGDTPAPPAPTTTTPTTPTTTTETPQQRDARLRNAVRQLRSKSRDTIIGPVRPVGSIRG